LPPNLDQTDLTTFDSAELARHNVIAYAPTYPLWTDDAGKLRMVRVPIGQSIRFDKKTQLFSIPDNTRFYKTFLKKVVDLNGAERWKKIETRVIVSRKDKPLFGTYVWDENETKATLLLDALRDGEPFRDRVVLVVTNEQKATEIRAKNPRNLTFELQRAGVLRHYAIPGRDRCIQCHMGSPSESFILGFAPMDVLRRPVGEGGVIEPTGPDELTQLDRLVDYGVISGLDSASDVTLLEDSQGDRKPRNEHELLAQGYMFGNCSHCHNPKGYPSQQAPELAPLLNFYPSTDGGIFQFPLERFSPRIHRGIDGQVNLPYITPSLYDIVPDDKNLWKPKAAVEPKTGTLLVRYLEAPWRSLIWRNTDTPFPYAEDYTIYPHMPMNSPGFDCRAPQLLGDWMVSIPAVRKDTTTWEAFVDIPENSGVEQPGPPERESQPYVEVKPGEDGYDKAVAAAKTRFEKWRNGNRYSRCPDTSDIVDQKVVDGERLVPIDGEIYALKDYIQDDGVPDRPHWIETDLTELPPPWYPRRLDWKEILIDGTFPTLDPTKIDYPVEVQKQNELRNVVDLIQHSQLDQAFKTFANTPVPFGVWEQKPGCDFSKVPKLGDLPNRPAWATEDLAPQTPVYMSSPGAAVYGTICINCHGPNADSQGIQAQKVAELTGGNTRVANFVKGLFGPQDEPFANRERIFSEQTVVPPDTMAARYMAFMGLGGTQREIPRPVLNLVAQTAVLGVKRPNVLAVTVSANMLAVAEELCRAVLHPTTGDFALQMDDRGGPLIKFNGDEELWKKLCTFNNSQWVRVVQFNGVKLTFFGYDFRAASSYPANTVVGKAGGLEASLSAGNTLPWCIQPPTDPAKLAEAQAFVQTRAVNGVPLPFCPQAVLDSPVLDVPTVDNWAKRGAINAGFAVYSYLDELANGRANRIRYNECELLSK
jgi:mono/diheme cytochrome c family protein